MSALPVYPDWPDMYLNAYRQPGLAPPGAGDLLFRASTEGSMSLCPARTETRTVASEKMFFGTVQHAMIERRGIIPWDNAEVDDLADELLEAEGLGDSLVRLLGFDMAAHEAWCDEQIALNKAWRTWWHQQPLVTIDQELSMIHPVTVAPNGHRIWLGGTADAICEHAHTRHLVGVDWKTSGSMWRQSKADGTRQDDLYAWLYKQTHGGDIGEWWFAIGNRSDGKWAGLSTTVTPASQAAAVEAVRRMALYLASGLPPLYTPLDTFGGRGWHCKPEYCANWGNCEGRYLGDEYDDKPPVTDEW